MVVDIISTTTAMRSGDSSKYSPSDQWNDAFIKLQEFQTEALFSFNNFYISNILLLINYFTRVHFENWRFFFPFKYFFQGHINVDATNIFCYFCLQWSFDLFVLKNSSFKIYTTISHTISPNKRPEGHIAHIRNNS